MRIISHPHPRLSPISVVFSLFRGAAAVVAATTDAATAAVSDTTFYPVSFCAAAAPSAAGQQVHDLNWEDGASRDYDADAAMNLLRYRLHHSDTSYISVMDR